MLGLMPRFSWCSARAKSDTEIRHVFFLSKRLYVLMTAIPTSPRYLQMLL